jgi:putative two-component system response regulator
MNTNWHAPAQAPVPSSGLVLVVDDVVANVALLERLLTRGGYLVTTATNGLEALDAVQIAHPDLVLMDVRMPGLDGFQVCRALKQDPATRLIPVVLLTGLGDPEDRLRGIDAGADNFVSKPFSAQELLARIRSLIRIKRYTDDLDSADSVILSLALTIEARDPSTTGHCHRLASYASILGRHLGMSDEDVAVLERGAFLHDMGKVGIPDSVLLKPGRLTLSEFELMKQHTIIGDRLCGELRSLRRVRPIVRHHHERLDGSGYPDALQGDAIPLLAQIIGVVDVFDALTSVRPYRAAVTAERAHQELTFEVNRGWRRRDIVEAFTRVGSEGRLPFQAQEPLVHQAQ